MNKLKIIILIIPLLLMILPSSVSAKEGDFYEKYEDKFEEANLPDNYTDTLKKYDSKTNGFNCGKLSIECKIHAFQLNWAVGMSNFVSQATRMLVMEPEMITQDRGFVRFKNYMQGLSTSLFVAFIIWQIMTMMMRRFGDPDDYPEAMNQKLLAVFAGGILLGLYEQIFDIILMVQHDVATGILKSSVDREQLLLMSMLYTHEYSVIFVMFLLIIMVVFSIALVYRFVSIGFFYVVGPVAITTIVNEEFNYFQLWLKYIVNNVVTLFLQTLAFTLAIGALTGQFKYTDSLPHGVDVVAGMLLAIVFCFFALVIPSILGNMGSSTGTGRMLGRVARYALTRR